MDTVASGKRAAAAPISLAYSVDADDAFMFHAIRHGLVDREGLEFTHRRADTATLNDWARRGEADVVAVSLGAMPELAARYLLLPHGASVGRGFGPVVVARAPTALAALAGKRVAIPGTSTTAWLVLRLMRPDLVPVVVPIAPFSRTFDALASGEVDAALLIHEGRLLYQARGFARVAELGEWWQAEAGLPLPLGVNVIRRALGASTIERVSRVLARAIAYALAHQGDLVRVLATEDRGDPALTDPALLHRYLGMYANRDTAATAPDVRRAIDELFARARAAGLVDGDVVIDWAP